MTEDIREAANSASESTDQSPKESRPAFPLNRLLPNVEKQGQRRAVEVGFLLGLISSLIGGLFVWVETFSKQPSAESFFVIVLILPVCMVPGILLGLWGGIIFGTLYFAFAGLGDFLMRRLGRKEEPGACLPPRSALAKTDSLDQPRRKRKRKKKPTGIVDLSHPDERAIDEDKLDIQAEDTKA